MIMLTIIQKTPQFIGLLSKVGKIEGTIILATITTTEKMKLTQQEAAVMRFEYKDHINGPRKAPAKAPHEIPINWAIKVTLLLY